MNKEEYSVPLEVRARKYTTGLPLISTGGSSYRPRGDMAAQRQDSLQSNYSGRPELQWWKE